MASMKDAALAYAERGWPVFPCRVNKQPYTESGVLEATTNRRKIREWWDTWPNANIGCDVGGANMVVVDLDPGHDVAQLEESVGGELPPTALVQHTPRGGSHLFYSKDKEEVIPPSVSKVADKVDVRSHHSYVLLAPSKTRDGGYQWEGKTNGDTPDALPAYRPQGLVDAAARNVRARDEDHDTWLIEPDLAENIDLAVAYLRNEAQIAVEGRNGDDMAYRTAAMCKSYGLSPETALEVMWEHWNPRCQPPWSPHEWEHLEGKVANAYHYNTSPPGNMTPAYKVARQASLFKPVVSRDTKTGGKEAEVGRFRFVDEAGVRSIKSPEWLVPGAIPEGAFAMLIGPRSTYKTFVALDIALSVAAGSAEWYESESDWRGPWPNVRVSGPVLFAAGEGRGGFKGRVEAWKDYHLDGEDTGNFYLADPVPYPDEDDLTAFINGALELEPDGYELVVLDTLGRSMQGRNENAQQDASQFTQMVQELQRNLDCAVLVIHHTGHGTETQGRARGSSVFGADVDVEFVIERADDGFVHVFNTKQKDAPEWEAGKLIKVEPHNGSLVAIAPLKVKDAKPPPEKPGEVSRDTKKGGGRKSKEDMEIELSVVRKAAYQTMKRYPGKVWSKRSLSEAIAAHETVEVAAGTIRNKYLDHLLTDKTHPVAACFDPGTGQWCYQGKGKRKRDNG